MYRFVYLLGALFLFFLSSALQAMDISKETILNMKSKLKSRNDEIVPQKIQEQPPQTAKIINGQFIVNTDELNDRKRTLKKVDIPRVVLVSPETALLLSIRNGREKERNVQRSEEARKALLQREEERANGEKWAFAQQSLGKWQRDLNTRYYPVTVESILAKAAEFQTNEKSSRFDTLDQKEEIRHLFECTLYLEDEKFYQAREYTLSLVKETAHTLFSPSHRAEDMFAHLTIKDEGRLINIECIVQDCYNLCSILQKNNYFQQTDTTLISRSDLIVHIDLSLFLHEEIKNPIFLKTPEQISVASSCLDLFKTYGKNDFFTNDECTTINSRRSAAAYFLTSLKYAGPAYNYYTHKGHVKFNQEALDEAQAYLVEMLEKSYIEEHSYSCDS
ncbi:MAG: hypothetical protein K2X98_00860 [Alphaproteobacteria bacterium]|nr:hypothetical protein [Alphaproteobacteria bacterium]